MRGTKTGLFPNCFLRLRIECTQCGSASVFATVNADDTTTDEHGRVVLAAEQLIFAISFGQLAVAGV